jgi:aspartate aminotransferase
MPSVASSVERVPHSRIRELAEIAMGMDGVLRLYFGESNLPTPDYIKRAAVEALENGYTFYTENAGLPSLRRAIAENYRRLHGVELDPAGEIVVTASGVQALNVGIRCALDPGDEALVLTPAWPNGSSSIAMANAVVRRDRAPAVRRPLCLRFRRACGAADDSAHAPACCTPRPRIRWAGWRRRQEQDQAAGICPAPRSVAAGRRGLRPAVLLRRGRWGSRRPPILRKATRDDAVMVVHSFSKSFCDDRVGVVGWLVARRDSGGEGGAVERVHHLARALPFAQKAGETALWPQARAGVAPDARHGFEENRDTCLEALSGASMG